jgi:diguanylate cyclase (GGDEF)-like protein/PAS domain S-box-containing protein
VDSDDLSGLQYAALQSAANGVVITDASGTVVWANPAFSRLTGYQLHEMLGRSTRMLRSGKHDAAFYANLWQTILSGKTWSGDIVNRRKDGRLYHEEQTITPVFGPGRLVTHFIAIKQDVTERRRTEDELQQARIDLAARLAEIQLLNAKLHAQAIRDPLTGLFNRRYFDETVARELARLHRSKLPLGIVALDVDHFKGINDRHGHAFGDDVLRSLADTLRSSVRVSDVPCRFGGEEFVVAMPGAPEQIAVQRAEQWRRAIENLKMCLNGEPVPTTVSVGVSVWSGGRESLDAALLRADGALYEAKQTGRNRVVAWHAGCRVPSSAPAWGRSHAVTGAPKSSAATERSD